MDLRKRRSSNAGVPDSLEQPLLDQDAEPATSSGRSTADPGEFAIVPHSINRIDWESLWLALAGICRAGWEGVVATISSCFGTLFAKRPGAQQSLTSIQEDRLHRLQARIQEPYDATSTSHQRALRELWRHAFPREALTSLRNRKWMEMGWQQDDPGSDFRGAGIVALENLLYMAQHKPQVFERLLHKMDGERSQWEYPFAVAGVNLTYMLEEVLDLRKQHTGSVGHMPATVAGRTFLSLLSEDDCVFEEVYCTTFEALDKAWLEMRASYMDFPAVMQRVRSRTHDALSRRPTCLAELQTAILH